MVITHSAKCLKYIKRGRGVGLSVTLISVESIIRCRQQAGVWLRCCIIYIYKLYGFVGVCMWLWLRVYWGVHTSTHLICYLLPSNCFPCDTDFCWLFAASAQSKHMWLCVCRLFMFTFHFHCLFISVIVITSVCMNFSIFFLFFPVGVLSKFV